MRALFVTVVGEQKISQEVQRVRIQGMALQLGVDHFRVGQTIGKNLGIGRSLPLAGEILGPLLVPLLARVGGQIVIKQGSDRLRWQLLQGELQDRVGISHITESAVPRGDLQAGFRGGWIRLCPIVRCRDGRFLACFFPCDRNHPAFRARIGQQWHDG